MSWLICSEQDVLKSCIERKFCPPTQLNSLWTLSNLTFSELDPRVRTNWILLTFNLAHGTLFFQCGLNASLKSPWKNLTWSPMNAQCRWNQRQQTLFKVLHEILQLSCAKINKLTYLQISVGVQGFLFGRRWKMCRIFFSNSLVCIYTSKCIEIEFLSLFCI